MTLILNSLLPELVTRSTSPQPQQSNPQPASNNDLSCAQPETRGIASSTNNSCSDVDTNPTMSDLNQDQRLEGHSGANGFAGAGNESLSASSSIAVNSKELSSETNDAGKSENAGHTLESTSMNGGGSNTDTSVGDSSDTSRHSALPGPGRHINFDDVSESIESTAQTSEIYDTSAQSLLPEDDGMGALRRRIHAIRDLGQDSTEQARMIHELMTERYISSQAFSGGHLSPISSPTPSFRSPERAHTPNRWSGQSFVQPPVSTTSTATSPIQDVFHEVTADDLKPTFHPRAETELPVDDTEDVDAEEFEGPFLGCPHYKRNVKLQCFDCKKWYTCRFCHDEVEDHHLDRPKTENMLCMLCGHAQSAAQYCKWCAELAAEYYCDVCKLWDNDASKSIYHCNDCGICRIGKGIGKDFFHCKTCSVCLPISIEKTHRCIERSTQCDCPICGDYMFTSPETVVFMRCGHSIHQRCLSEYSKSSYRCPICSKTITNMEATFRNLDRTIESQPMPVDFKDTKAIITCNDCGTKSVVKYHWLGLKCDMCESYNSTQLSVLQGDGVDLPDQGVEDASIPNSRKRSSSQGVDESTLPSLAPLQIDASSAPGVGAYPQFSAPQSAHPTGQFRSYNLTRGRAISPIISNYFGIPPDRHSERSTSTSFFGSQAVHNDENDGEGELNIWGTKFKYRYGFLSRATDPTEDDDEGGEQSASSDSDEKNEDDEDEDDDEGIDIFGHR